MRGILFRGKDKDDGNWHEGYYLQLKDTTYCCLPSDNAEEANRLNKENEHHYIVFERMTDWGLPNKHLRAEVLPETVCQYTGLPDKNGRKIFEGDILSGERYHDWGQGGEYVPDKCVIKWNEKRAAFDPVYWWEGYNHDLKDYEVIGNIFDNPELLEGSL